MAAQSAAAFAAAIARMKSCGGSLVEVDFTPFAEAAALLYQSSFVAERYSGIRAFLDRKQQTAAGPEGSLVQQRELLSDQRLLPVTRTIIAGAGASRGWSCTKYNRVHAAPGQCVLLEALMDKVQNISYPLIGLSVIC